ncbi:MAG: hypothetical protein K9M49_08555 [Candidatus Marinimicrobia bacterium]|nr:hypothetical protein [Candidatus Neomarinimicrobiota bacterium]MCF7850462.1 hypothetical protein [Candidatus Neomarinimicrobiota bacterium]MCF7905187.1 hypothetical protein [Candidatus Neomarinimicrobiota bacterium]
MKEDKKIGYLAIIVGVISLWEAWMNILEGKSDMLEIFFLSLGLVCSLFGIALLLQKKRSAHEKR